MKFFETALLAFRKSTSRNFRKYIIINSILAILSSYALNTGGSLHTRQIY